MHAQEHYMAWSGKHISFKPCSGRIAFITLDASQTKTKIENKTRLEVGTPHRVGSLVRLPEFIGCRLSNLEIFLSE